MTYKNVRNREIFKNELIEACQNNNSRKLTELFHNDILLIKNNEYFLSQLVLETQMCTNLTEKLICYPCKAGYIDVIKILNEQNFSYKFQTREGYPLQIACRYGHIDIVKYLMEQIGSVVSKFDGVESPVAICTIYGHLDILEYLVSQSVSIDVESIPPLVYYAAINGHAKILHFLIGKLHCQLDLSMKIQNGQFSLLELACITNQHSVIKYLIGKGAIVTKETVDNYPYSIAKVLGEKIVEKKEDVYIANWNGLKLEYIPEQALYNFSSLATVTISDAEMKLVNEVIFQLPNVTLIDLSSNQLRLLSPEDRHWRCSKLEILDLSKNMLESIPSSVFERLPNLENLNLSYNKLKNNIHPDIECNWNLEKLKILDLAKNNLTLLPDKFGKMHNLRVLKLQENSIKQIPNSLIESAQKLESLNLLNNQIKELPINMHLAWQTSLKELNLSRNKLEVIPNSVCQLKNLNYLTLSHNEIKFFPPTLNWTTSALQKLDLSYNKIKFINSTDKGQKSTHQKIFSTKLKHSSGYIKSSGLDEYFIEENMNEIPVALWANCLINLDLSYNEISIVPANFGELESLTILNLSNNRNLSELPLTLSKLKQCIHLSIENTKIQLPSTVYTEKQSTFKTKAILNYLHTELRDCVQCNHMKLMVVGLEKQGKTSLLNALYTPQSMNSEHKISTDGIHIKNFKLSKKKQAIEFSSWDLAGQEVYYATHQCFLTRNTLYLVVFNMTRGNEGILELQPWLLNIQARAPNSSVVVVGTHFDKMDDQSVAKQDEMMKQILKLYGTNKQPSLYPKIVKVDFVSCTKMTNIERLTNKIIDSAAQCINPDTREKVIGEMIPKSYFELQNLLQKEAEDRRSRGETLVLKYKDILSIVQSISETDIQNKKELDKAAQFLHNNGYILHYSDMIGSLAELYFIDPTWIVDMFAQIISVKEKQSFVKDGIISEKDISFLFQKTKNKYLFEKYVKEYLFIMEKFEILSAIGGGRFLVPSMLPTNRSEILLLNNKIQSGVDFDTVKKFGYEQEGYIVTEQGKVLRRRICFSFVPSGFWNRLISRILIKIKNKFYPDNLPIERDEENKGLHYWKRGIAMINDECNFIIESLSQGISDISGVQVSDLYYRKNKFLLTELEIDSSTTSELPGVDIIVYSEKHDFSWLGFLVDEVESLLTEWYPGLEELDIYGESSIKRYIPWKLPQIITLTLSDDEKITHKRIEKINDDYFYMFSYEECIRTISNKPNIYCEDLKVEIPLEFLIPEISLGDLHPDFKLNLQELIFDRKQDLIGEGATANVYKGTYSFRYVAIKELNIDNTDQKHLSSVTSGKVMHGSLETIIHNLRLIRNELQFLCKFQHPFMVELIGASIRPMLIVLELAPLGSLSDILSAKADKEHTEWTQKNNAAAPPPMRGGVLGHRMTVKIALQIILAIDYLHNKSIIYRDLKSQNVLLFSLSDNDLVNVKLSDYGISLVAQPAYNKGLEGTPGFVPAEGIVQKNHENIITNKVDIFAYGMLLYELITGRYPYYPKSYLHDINKAVINGQSPDIYSQNRNPCFSIFINLMKDCWEMIPSKRPTAKEIFQKLIDPSFFMNRVSFTEIINDPIDIVEKIAAIPVQGVGRNSKLRNYNYLCAWGSDRYTKRCCLIDIETGKKMETSLPTEGRVMSVCVVQQDEHTMPRVWISIRKERDAKIEFYRSIEIYGQLFKDGPYTCLWRYKTIDTVLCLKFDVLDERPIIFSSLLSGHVITYGRKQDFHQDKMFSYIPQDAYKYVVESAANECMTWSISHTVQIGNEPVTAMVKCNDEELWCACGSDIEIISRRTRNPIYRISMNGKEEKITFLQLEYFEDNVYAILSKGDNSKVIIIDVKSRISKGYLLCNQINPYKLMIYNENILSENQNNLSASQENEIELLVDNTDIDTVRKRWTLIPNSIGLRQYPRIHHFPHKDSIADHLNLSQDKSNYAGRRFMKTERQSTRLRAIQIDKGLLWIARALGDILVVNLNRKSENYSRVVARLKTPYNNETCYDGRSQSLLSQVQSNYIVNYQDRELGVNNRNSCPPVDEKEKEKRKEKKKLHFDVWETISLEELEQIHYQNDKIISMHNITLSSKS